MFVWFIVLFCILRIKIWKIFIYKILFILFVLLFLILVGGLRKRFWELFVSDFVLGIVFWEFFLRLYKIIDIKWKIKYLFGFGKKVWHEYIMLYICVGVGGK